MPLHTSITICDPKHLFKLFTGTGKGIFRILSSELSLDWLAKNKEISVSFIHHQVHILMDMQPRAIWFNKNVYSFFFFSVLPWWLIDFKCLIKLTGFSMLWERDENETFKYLGVIIMKTTGVLLALYLMSLCVCICVCAYVCRRVKWNSWSTLTCPMEGNTKWN